jgi:hypothetical protein
MPLSWDLTDVPNWEMSCCDDNGDISADTQHIILSTVHTGIGGITETNVRLVAMRMEMIRMCFNFGEKLPLEAIERHIGLKTNAATMTPSQFYARCIDRLEYRAKRGLFTWGEE